MDAIDTIKHIIGLNELLIDKMMVLPSILVKYTKTIHRK